MTLSTLISALAKRGASEANVRAGSEIQICVNNEWRAQTANLTDAALDDMIAKALPLDEEAAWRAPNGRASFSAQNYSIEASKQAGAVSIQLKRVAAKPSNGGALTAQSAGELKKSAFNGVTAFAPVADAAPVPAPPTPATPPVSWPNSMPVAPTNVAPLPMPNAVGEWHYCDASGLQRGPISMIQIRSLINMTTINAQTLVWKDGMEDWLPLAQTLVWKDGMKDWLPLAQTELSRFLPQKEGTNPFGVPNLEQLIFGVLEKLEIFNLQSLILNAGIRNRLTGIPLGRN